MQGFNERWFRLGQRQQGVTLVELLVALLLGIVLSTAMIRVYVQHKKSYVLNEEMTRMQENSRFVLHLFKHELKMAGFFAGTRISPQPETVAKIGHDCTKGWALNALSPVDFFDNPTNVKSLSQGDLFFRCIKKSAYIQVGTDIISIKRSANLPIIDHGRFASGSVAGEKSPGFYLEKTGVGNPVLKYAGKTFPVSTPVSAINPDLQVSVWPYMAKIFYVRNYSLVEGDDIPTLMMISLQDKALVETALIEGVEALHIEFGIPSATSQGTPVRFVVNPDNEQLALATVVRLYLLMRTRNEISGYIDRKSYSLGSMPAISPGGHYMRRILGTTIKIRNR